MMLTSRQFAQEVSYDRLSDREEACAQRAKVEHKVENPSQISSARQGRSRFLSCARQSVHAIKWNNIKAETEWKQRATGPGSDHLRPQPDLSAPADKCVQRSVITVGAAQREVAGYSSEAGYSRVARSKRIATWTVQTFSAETTSSRTGKKMIGKKFPAMEKEHPINWFLLREKSVFVSETSIASAIPILFSLR